MPAERDVGRAVLVASMTAVALIAFQMGAKATRDALFLSSFDVAALPAMVIGSAVLSLVLAFAAARLLTAVGPARLVPATFVASALLLVVEWRLVTDFRGAVAIFVYLHYGALGALLVSGFWSLVNERFDPRTAKRQIGRIAVGGTVGGVLGGILAERVAVYLSIDAMLPILAGLHLVCGALCWQLRPPRSPARPDHATPPTDPESRESGLTVLSRSPYLRTIVALVVVTTMTEGLIDWVFKARATAAFGRGEDLLRLFAVFYTGVAVLTVAVQAVASRAALQRFGLARTVAGLPAMVAAGSLGALAVPGLWSAAALRGTESIVRHGLYRPGYELLFTPIAPRRKRAIKALIDVAAVRLGDIGGGALVQAMLFIAAAAAGGTLLATAVALSLLGIVLAVRLHRGYVRSLEKSLVARAGQVSDDAAGDSLAQATLFQSTGMLHLSASGLTLPEREAAGPTEPLEEATPREQVAADIGLAPAATPVPAPDPTLTRITELRSRDAARVRRALSAGPVTAEVAPHAIRLLAWDPVLPDALRVLRDAAPRITGQLVDALLDPDEEFSIRRRIPMVLAAAPTVRAFDGLFHGLLDRRFEVRYRCGRALVRLQEGNGDLTVDRDLAVGAILREVAVDRGVWESHRLLDAAQADDEDWSPLAGAALRERANRSLEHVFTLLALILPREPLSVAFRALQTDDPQLRGTALEYLETALPGRVREQLWPFLEDRPARTRTTRDADDVLRDLMQSNESIAINLRALRRRSDGG